MPIRMIREGFIDSEKINSISVGAQLFFVRLMLVADDFGRFDGRASIMRPRMYPLALESVSEKHIKEWIIECKKSEIILCYEYKNKPYIQILNFNQRLRAKKSKYPSPDSHVPF